MRIGLLQVILHVIPDGIFQRGKVHRSTGFFELAHVGFGKILVLIAQPFRHFDVFDVGRRVHRRVNRRSGRSGCPWAPARAQIENAVRLRML